MPYCKHDANHELCLNICRAHGIVAKAPPRNEFGKFWQTRPNNVHFESPNVLLFYFICLISSVFVNLHVADHTFVCSLDMKIAASCFTSLPPFRGMLQRRKGTTNPKNLPPPKCSVRKLFTLLGHCLKKVENMSFVKKNKNMLPYRVQYNESESDIQNNNDLRNSPKCQNTFEILKIKSTVYPPKQTRTDVSGHASGAEFWCASFIQICYF